MEPATLGESKPRLAFLGSNCSRRSRTRGDIVAKQMSPLNINAIRSHYDRLSIFYWWLWGEHIHHGFWQNGESVDKAQIRLIEELADRTQIRRRAKVLDVGCGLGGSSFWLARKLDCSVLGITISPVQKRLAERRARSFGLSNRVRFAVRDANELDFGTESFDAIWSIECSEHLFEKERFIRNCARVLRSGGMLGLCTWLTAEPSSPSANPTLVVKICSGMLCASLVTFNDYIRWMNGSGFREIHADDVTRQVEKTWEICQDILHRPVVRAVLPFMGSRTREFITGFSGMRRAYREGAMQYGMLTARKT
jgi:tocopherol O-methyltransferase